jgi:hypothetical protein
LQIPEGGRRGERKTVTVLLEAGVEKLHQRDVVGLVFRFPTAVVSDGILPVDIDTLFSRLSGYAQEKIERALASNPYVCITSRQLPTNVALLLAELATSENRLCVGGSLNVQPPMLRKTFRPGKPFLSSVVSLHSLESPAVISTILKDEEMRPNAKLTWVKVLPSICWGEKEEHLRELAQPS